MRTKLDPTLRGYFIGNGFLDIIGLMKANHELSLALNEDLLNATIDKVENFAWVLNTLPSPVENYGSILDKSESLKNLFSTRVQPILINRLTNRLGRLNREINLKITQILNNLADFQENCKDCIEWESWPTFEKLQEISWKQSLDACINFNLKPGTKFYTDKNLNQSSFVDGSVEYNTLLFKGNDGLIYSYFSYKFPEEFDETKKIYFKKEDLKIKEFRWELNNTDLFSADHESIEQIRQGCIGDSFLIASIISITLSDPYFFTRKIAENVDTNYVYVKMYKKTNRGKFEPVYIEVDKKVISFSDDNNEDYSLAFSKNVIWPAVLEKAYAIYRSKLENQTSIQINTTSKKNNALKYLVKGAANDCLEILTGVAYQKINFDQNYNECTFRDFLNLKLWNSDQEKLTLEISNTINDFPDGDVGDYLDVSGSYFWAEMAPPQWKASKSGKIKRDVFQSWNNFLISKAKFKFFQDRIYHCPLGKRSDITLSEFESLLDGTALYQNPKKVIDIENPKISDGIIMSDCRTWITTWAIKLSLFPREGVRHELNPFHFQEGLPDLEIMTAPQVELLTDFMNQIAKKDFPVLIKENSDQVIGISDVENNFILKTIHNRIAFVLNPLIEANAESKSRTAYLTPLQLISWFNSYTKKVEV